VAYSYARRQALAREKGFTSYGQYRRATEYARKSPEFQRIVGGVGGARGENLDAAKTYYQAFVQGDKDDYSLRKSHGNRVVKIVDGKPRGAKAKWIIDYAGYIDEEAWRERYPRGRRR
jgi:hypothetical protein